MNAICGLCGTNEDNKENGFCINGHDHWVELRDFGETDLESWVADAAKVLKVSISDLYDAVKSNKSIIVSKN